MTVLVNDLLRPRVEPLYEDAILRSLQRIQSAIFAKDLTVQWDAALEFAMLEGAEFHGKVESWFGDAFEGIIARLIRLGDAVEEKVEMGFHFCYGDAGHKHYIEPKDMGWLVKVAIAVLARCKRQINYIHVPVPKDRLDRAYFEPLKDLAGHLEGTELILGLVHADDLQGTEARIKAAGEFVQSFRVANECGLGRTPKEQLDSIFEISQAVSEPVR